jgi:thiol-disulfide isomerase/thioredoxin
MKRTITLAAIFWSIFSMAQTVKPGYEIKVTFKPFKNEYIYLGHYFGKSYPIIDSVKLNDKSEAIFKGTKKLNGGIYLIGYPGRAGFFEILVDKEQHFSVIADTATIARELKFINSVDNELFNKYQQFMTAKGKVINEMREKYKTAATKKDSTEATDKLAKTDKEINDFRLDIMKKNPKSILTALLQTMREPELTGKLKDPKTKEDSTEAWQYFKSHYWDGVNFWDGRLAYTTFFEEKLDKYFNQLVVPNPDSVIKELDWMLGFASLNEEMNRFLLIKFLNRYLNQKYMWEDAIFVHLFEKYFSNKSYSWLNENGKKIITERAYSLMANIMGSPATDIDLPDSTGKNITLYQTKAPYTVVVFWDPTCGHCKEVLPKLDSFYTAKWKAAGLKLYAVAKETDGTRKNWIDFVTEQKLWDWTHVYYSKAADKIRTDNNVPGYSQLYDVLSFPTLYLLDKDKRIIAKKLSYQQIDDVLQLKLKGQ